MSETPSISLRDFYALANKIVDLAGLIVSGWDYEAMNRLDSIDSLAYHIGALSGKLCCLYVNLMEGHRLEQVINAARQLAPVEEHRNALRTVYSLGTKIQIAAGCVHVAAGHFPKESDLSQVEFWQTSYRDHFLGLAHDKQTWKKFLKSFRKRLPEVNHQALCTSLALEEAAAGQAETPATAPTPPVDAKEYVTLDMAAADKTPPADAEDDGGKPKRQPNHTDRRILAFCRRKAHKGST